AAEVRADLSLVAEGKSPYSRSESTSQRNSGTHKLHLPIENKKEKEQVEKFLGSADQYVRSDLMAAKLRQFSRQRMFEICIFLVLTGIWVVPLLLAFASSPNALIAACLFGVLLPFLAAVAAMVAVRVPRVRSFNLPITSTALVPSGFWGGETREMQEPGTVFDGALLLGTEHNIWARKFGAVVKHRIEPFQRVRSLPLLILGKEATGKTRLLASLASNDLDDARRAQLILSPDGVLSDLLLRWIASHPQGNLMARRVLLLDLDHELLQSPAEPESLTLIQEVSERIVEAMQDAEFIGPKTSLTSEQSYVLQSSISLLLSAGQDLTNLPAFLTQASKRQEIFEKLKLNQAGGKGKSPLASMRKLIEERSAEDWEALTKPLLAICYRFPLESDTAVLRLFGHKLSLFSEVISKRRAMIVRGSQNARPLFFRLVFNEILKERRPSARLSDAESCPVVYVDDVERCGISDKFAQILGTPAEIGIEFLLSTRTLADFSAEETAKILTEVGGLAVFAVSDADAQAIKPLYDAQNASKSTFLPEVSLLPGPSGLLGILESDRPLSFKHKDQASTQLLTGQAPSVYHYISNAPGAKPKRLLAPPFHEIRITEVEWSIVESMRTGWIFNL
ncbi:MAG TPA: hypothetical protein PKZ32_15605, partial [Candidatus Melainabacteria bacterium]|nr:hypothetical protein [Candidatus Melainabacteria bacterium]